MRIENSIRIDAPPRVVWRVTTDVERWPEWTPTVTRVERRDDGPLGRGSVVRLKQPLQPAADWVVTTLDEERRFVWESRRPGLRLIGGHEMHPDGEGTRSVLTVDAMGPLAVLLWPLLRPGVRRALSLENQGLKSRCEAITRGDPAAS